MIGQVSTRLVVHSSTNAPLNLTLIHPTMERHPKAKKIVSLAFAECHCFVLVLARHPLCNSTLVTVPR